MNSIRRSTFYVYLFLNYTMQFKYKITEEPNLQNRTLAPAVVSLSTFEVLWCFDFHEIESLFCLYDYFCKCFPYAGVFSYDPSTPRTRHGSLTISRLKIPIISCSYDRQWNFTSADQTHTRFILQVIHKRETRGSWFIQNNRVIYCLSLITWYETK